MSEAFYKLYELHCEKCDIPICSLCVSSTEHEGHKLVDYTLKIIETKKGIETRVKGIHKIYLSWIPKDCIIHYNSERWYK